MIFLGCLAVPRLKVENGGRLDDGDRRLVRLR